MEKKKTSLNKKDKRKVKKLEKRRIIGLFWTALILSLIFVVGVFALSSAGFFGEMPNVNDLESPDIYVASEIISSDGIILDKYEKEKRIPVSFDSLPPDLVNALIAKEDNRYYDHSGIDFRRTLSATAQLGRAGGASTITQQLSKLLFSKKPRNIIERIMQKVKENIIAVRLERLYTKDEIITMYLNKFDFTRGAYGIQMASKIYFDKDVSKLNLGECATLVAMLQLPSGYNPVSNPENSIKGRNGVLVQMEKYGYLSLPQTKAAMAEPLSVNYKPNRTIGSTYSSYYKYALRKDIESYLADYESKYHKKYDLYKDGLKIYVTLNSHMQQYAEDAIRSHLTKVVQPNYNWRVRKGSRNYPYSASMSRKFHDTLIMKSVRRSERYKNGKAAGKSEQEILKEFDKPTRLEIFTWKNGIVDTLMTPMDSLKYHKTIAQAGFMAMETHTGQIKAWVGGVDWNFFKYDHVKQGRRQVGSTFKPFVYATAIVDLDYTPCVSISNATYSNGSYRVPGRGGMISLRDGLAHSQNPVALRLIERAGVDKVIDMARELGVTSPLKRDNTIALGSGDITIYEMVGAYATFGNYGTYTKPELIWRIEDNKGKVILENAPETRMVMNELYAYTMLDIMKGVTTYGTAKRIRGYGLTGEIAGKTGTTDDNSDGWFIGITPDLAAGCWVGFQERYSRNHADGARMAMPIYAQFMKKVFDDKSLGYKQDTKFAMPTEVEENGGFDCKILLGATGDGEPLPTITEIIEGINDEGPVQSSAPRLHDEGVNTKLNKKDTLENQIEEELERDLVN